jgi:hypothetical protein
MLANLRRDTLGWLSRRWQRETPNLHSDRKVQYFDLVLISSGHGNPLTLIAERFDGC